MIQFVKRPEPDNRHDKTEVTITLPGWEITKDDLYEAFKEFLLACGFHVDGIIDEVSEAVPDREEDEQSS